MSRRDAGGRGGGSRLEESLEARARRIFRETPVLETPRLTLRRMRPEDAEQMHRYASDPEVARYMLWEPHESLRDSENFLRFVRERYSRGDPAGWGLEERETGRFMGTCGMQAWRPEHSRAELGYVLAREHWGRGLMTEAVAAVVNFGFERIGFNRLEARCLDGNIASARVLEKVGMIWEGTSRSSHFLGGSFRNLHHYAMLKGDVRGEE